ncbi:MAG: ATP-binding protein [Bdellovibrionales bacterium]|nr:ATP-binding protein [Bdellovibrionales bacterium]
MITKNRIINISTNKNSFLFGVRGSGKTYLLKHLFPPSPSILYVDLLDRTVYQNYLSNTGLFYERVNAFRNDCLVIVDEIQKIPHLLDEIHRLIESSNRRFILTGSSARKIKATKGVNLLGGRAGKKLLHPFTPEELGEDFDLNEALHHGLLPIVWSSVDRSSKLKDYAETYLTEEIKAEALTRNLPAFARFLEVASLYHGQVVNMSSVARDSGNKIHYMREFFSILEDTMLGFFLPAYQAKLRVKEKKSKKFYFIDPGIVRALKKNFGLVSVEEKGFLFEGLIAQILRAYKDYRNLYEDIYYWSSSEAKKTEVDFLLKRGKELIAIEVKAKNDVSSRDYRGLKAIGELPNVKRRIVVYMGQVIRKTEEGIEIWSFDFFCKNLTENFESSINYENKKSKKLPLPLENLYLETSRIPSFERKGQLEDYKRLNGSRNKKED